MARDEDIIGLVRRVKMGDKDAFGELVNRYKEQIYFMVYRMTNNHADADDLSQEAFIKAYEKIGGFREKSSFFTWLYRIAMNMTINHLKRTGRKQTFELDENICIEGNSNSPEKAVQQRQLHEEITKAINLLPLKQRVVIELALLEELPHKEIAKILRCPQKTISWRLFQARKKLKEKLSSYV